MHINYQLQVSGYANYQTFRYGFEGADIIFLLLPIINGSIANGQTNSFDERWLTSLLALFVVQPPLETSF